MIHTVLSHMASNEDVMVLMLSMIVQHLDSLGSLNRLIRTNKRLNIEAGNTYTISNVIENMEWMNWKSLSKLFVLPGKMKPSHLVNKNGHLSLHRHSCKHQYFPRDAFSASLAINLTVHRINEVFLIRQHRSNVMKGLNVSKIRKQDIEQIMKDLDLRQEAIHHITDAERNYLRHSFIGILNPIFIDHKFMAHTISGILLHKDNTFRRIASTDSALLSKEEKLFVLGKNIAYEIFLLNHTNYLDIIRESRTEVDLDYHKVQYLFKPPSVWPWVTNSPRVNAAYDPDTNEQAYLAFRVDHDILY